MKFKPLSLTLAILTAITFSACDSSKEGSQISESSITSMNSAQEVSEIKSSSVNNLDFDFDEAISDMELFGNKISFPCTFEAFGSDFELYEDISIPFSDGQQKLTVMIKYKGKFIGSVVLDDCQLEDKNKIEKQVVALTLGDSGKNISTKSNWYNGLIELDFSGITYSSTETEVKQSLGTPTPKEGEYFVDRLSYYKSETEYLQLRFKENKIINFNLCIR